MVGKRPRRYTHVSQIKLATTIYQRILATRPDVSPEAAAKIAYEASEKNARKMEVASRIYHELKTTIVSEYNLPTQRLGAVRVLIQKTVMNIWRYYEAKGAPLNEDEVREIAEACIVVGTETLKLPEDVVRFVVAMVIRRLPEMVPPEVANAVTPAILV